MRPAPPVLLFDARDPRSRARFSPDPVDDWLIEDLVVTADGKILLVGCGDAIVALSPAGQVLWERKLRGTEYSHSPVGISVDVTGRIHVATHECPDWHGPFDTARYQLLPTGRIELIQPQAAMNLPPAIAPDGTVYQMDELNVVRAYAPDGTLLWEQGLAGYSQGMIALDESGNLYIGTDGSDFQGDSLWSLTADGEVRWSKGRGNYTTPAISPKGRIHFRDAVGNVTAFDTDGNEIWSIRGSGVPSLGALAVAGRAEVVYVPSSLGLSAVAGNLRWTFKPRGDLDTPPLGAIVDRDENVYVAFGDTLYSLTPEGRRRWDVPVPAAGRMVIGGPGLIYAVGGGHQLYRIADVSSDDSRREPGGRPVSRTAALAK
jgi:outer membrane protein assembly factor BamB